jgi:hypothetical protein
MGLRPKPPRLRRGTRLDSLKDLHEIITYSVLFNLQNIGIQSVIRPLVVQRRLDGLFPVTVPHNNVTIEMAIPENDTHYNFRQRCFGCFGLVDCFRYIHSVGGVLFTAQTRAQSLAEAT